MIKILGCWENGWNTPILEYDLYAFPAKEYGVDELIMTPVSGINKKVTEYATVEEAIKNNPDLEVVFVDEQGEDDLKDFNHPENVLYVFGRASYSPWKVIGGRSLKIDTPTENGRLWGHQAMGIVLHDRYSK